MKRFADVLLAIIVSFECAFVSGFSLFVFAKPHILVSLSTKVNTTNEFVNYLALIPPSIVIILYKQKDDLLFPAQSPATEWLQSWPHYHMLLDRFYVSVMWCILGSMFTLWIWIFNGDLSEYVTFSIFFGSIITSVITALTFFGATITLRRILATVTIKK